MRSTTRSAGCGAWSANLIAGLVRLQWWRDALDAIAADRPPAHPVVAAVHARWDRFAPLRPRLETAIHAREQELSGESPADLAALERNLAASSGEVTLAAMDLLGGGEELARTAARHLGLALGLVRLLQGLPGDLRRGRLPLPRALLARHEIDPERVDPMRSGGAAAGGRRAHEASARASA